MYLLCFSRNLMDFDECYTFNVIPFKHLKFHILILHLLHLRVYYELTKWSAPSWLDSSVGKSTAPVAQRSWARIPFKIDSFFFSAFIFSIAKVDGITSMIFHSIKNDLFLLIKSLPPLDSQVRRWSSKNSHKPSPHWWYSPTSIQPVNKTVREVN